VKHIINRISLFRTDHRWVHIVCAWRPLTWLEDHRPD